MRAFAKANISLNITGAAGGLHTLDSVMMSLDRFDTLTVTERADDKINVVFANAEIGEQNTAATAARKMCELVGRRGMDVFIEKGIPVGAGLGGSSADGAAVIRAFDVLYGLPHTADVRKAALSVGSDVPFMLTGGLARVRGVGEDMFFMENKLKIFAVGLMSGSVSTREAYGKFDEMYRDKQFCPTDTEKLCELLLSGDPAALGLSGNALYKPVSMLEPSVVHNAELLRECGATVNMTGSGGMVLGYFTDIDKFAACAARLRGKNGFAVFAPAKVGVMYEWIER